MNGVKMRILFIIAFGILLNACATPQSVISKNIGCPASETRILEADPGFGTSETIWRASCGEKQYKCNSGPYAGKTDWLKEVKCSDTPKDSPGYLTAEDLARERKQGFDAFLESLVAPSESTSGFTPETSKQ